MFVKNLNLASLFWMISSQWRKVQTQSLCINSPSAQKCSRLSEDRECCEYVWVFLREPFVIQFFTVQYFIEKHLLSQTKI